MFAPDRDQVRRFFSDAWKKHLAGTPVSPLESMVVDIVLAHPEYQDLLANADVAGQIEFTVEQGTMNPFLHLSLHLAIEEQLSIDQPKGLLSEFTRLLKRSGDRHAALHVVLDCLGEAVWRSQREGAPMDANAYLECIRRH